MEAHKISRNVLCDQNIKVSLRKGMCKCFIRELKPEIEQRIARNLDVQETVSDAFHSTDLQRNQDSTSNKALNTSTKTNHEKPVRYVIKKDIQLQTVEN